jgi:choline dehydrogenase-like flavoprotein
MRTIKTDVLVIGSGFGAAGPALRLSQAGFQVLMVEKGRDIVPQKDFKQTQDPKYLLQYLKGMSSATVSFTYAEGLGGGSGFYEMVSLRAPGLAFDQKDDQGRRLWPGAIDRQAMEAFYDLAEQMLNVEQISVAEIPKSGVVFSSLMRNLGYSCDRARYAVKGCVGSGFCISGCIFGAKQSLHYNYLPQAQRAGMEILTDTEAMKIRALDCDRYATRAYRHMAALPYRYAVHCRNDMRHEQFAVHAKLVILGGGTVGTAKLLLNSREHLPLLSGHVGKNIASNGSVKIAGLLPEGFIDGDMLSGRSHPGMISYEFLETMGLTISCAKPLPLQLLTAARIMLEGDTRQPAYWGEANVALMKLYRRRMVILYALGLTPPRAEIRRNGSSDFEVHLDLDNDLRSYHRRTKSLLQSILQHNGCKLLNDRPLNREGREYDDLHFSTTHMTGSCRMADHKRHGVVDAYGEVFDYPGLYVTDGAAIPTSLAVNSSLTILANAERIAAHLVKWYGGDGSKAPASVSE